MAEFTLNAESRKIEGKKVRQVRAKGLIPAIVYGHGIAPRMVAVPVIPFQKLYRAAGESSLVDLAVAGGSTVKVLIQDVQVHPLRGDFIHIDFLEVRMDEKLEADIMLSFVGESPAVKGLGGTLVKNAAHLKVRCLPAALVHEIAVDISGLKLFTDKIQVRDLVIPAGIEVLAPPPDETVAFIEEPRSEDEMKALETKPEAKIEEVKVATDEKKAEREKEKAEKKTE